MIRALQMWLANFRQRSAMKQFKGSITSMTKANKQLIDEKARVEREIVERRERATGYGTQIGSNQNLVDAMASVLNASVEEKETV